MKLKIWNRPQPVFEIPAPDAAARRDIEKSYARLFASADGQQVLAHLQGLTMMRALGPEAPEAHIRHAEGQRALVGTILRLIAAGK